MSATQLFIVALITVFLTQGVILVGMVLAYRSAQAARQEVGVVRTDVAAVHQVINSRLTELLELTRESAFAAGREDQRLSTDQHEEGRTP